MAAHVEYSPTQKAVIQRPVRGHVFLEGLVGSGKSTAGVGRLLHLLEQGIRGDSILVIVPQRTLAAPYDAALRCPELSPGSLVEIATVGGLARRAIDLFWPVVAGRAGFGDPNRAPTFLTMETAQYFMARIVDPLADKGYFESVTINRNRLYSQILDDLNKAAVVGFAHTEIGERLKSAWVGEPAQKHVYDQAQDCAARFRQYCLDNNLLDYSLQLEVFWDHLWTLDLCRGYLTGRYRHLICDNIEEDTPRAHDLIHAWLPDFQSSLLIYDREGGHRVFLGANPESAYELRHLCSEQVAFEESHVVSAGLGVLLNRFARSQGGEAEPELPEEVGPAEARSALAYESHRFHPEMVDWVAKQIALLVHERQVPPSEIVVMAPFLSDALRFNLVQRLRQADINVRSQRPSRALRDEPAVTCLLTLAKLAHPQWGQTPTNEEIANTLVQSITGMDLVRAKLLAGIVFRTRDGRAVLLPFGQLVPEMRERITYRLGHQYETLRAWLLAYQTSPEVELDHFLSRLFGEILSQDGYGFHTNLDAGESAARLIESVQKFRWVVGPQLRLEGRSVGLEYVRTVQAGVIAALYYHPGAEPDEDAVLLSPAFTYLLSNRPVDYQFWLDVGSLGWWERLDQPLTHPYVLSRSWPAGRVWADDDEYINNRLTLYRLSLGLIRRCRRRIYLGLSDLSEQGYDQQGPLLRVIQQVLRRLPTHPEIVNV